MFRMSKTEGRALLAAILLTVVLTPPAEAANPGEIGMLSLRIGVGAREAGMGDAGVASSRGAAAVYWNPANNVFAEFETEMVLQHHRYLGLFNQEAALIAHKAGDGVVGFFFTGFYSDTIERRGEDNTGIIEGTFKPYDVALGISYAYPLGEYFGVAANAKMIYEKIDIYSDTGFAFDFFVTHKAMIEGLMFAASLTNVGGQMKLKDQPFDLPTTIRVGAAWSPVLGGDNGDLTLTGDVVFPNDTTEKAHVGAEYRLLHEFALRVGTRLNYDNQGLTAGAGFRTGILGVDYAYGESTVEGIDDGHKFSLNLVW